MPIAHLLFTALLLFSAPKIMAEENLSPPQSFFNQQQDFLPINKAFSVMGEQASDGNILLNWTIAPGYYLYKSRFNFISDDVSVGDAVFPKGVIEDDPYIGKTEIYKDSVSIKLPIKKIEVSSASALLKVAFQGCAEAGFCYPPETIDVAIAINHHNISQPTTPQIVSNTIKTVPEHSALVYVLFAIIGGLILNLMPCVFPILSIKVLSFKASAENPRRLKIHGWVYTAGVVSCFVFIAMLLMYLRHAGAEIGWGFQLQNPPFIMALTILFFMMGLNLFGFFEIDLALSNKGHKLTQGHHLKASFFTGLLSVVVATPCTVPLMAPAIGFALTQSTIISLLIFASIGLGLALPFLILTHYPALISRLPKAGLWMQHVKQFLAFPLFLTAIWLLWVLGHQTSLNHALLVVIMCAVLAFAVWLWQLNYKKIMVVLLVMAGIAMYYGTQHEQRIDEPFTQARFDELRLAGEPIFINMTADWCITCLVNERLALSTSAVRTVIEQLNVRYLKGDWTNQNPEITAFLNKFNRSGVPLYVYYPAGANSKPILLPQLLTPNIVIETISSKTVQQ
jgi:thiol:disulfide interchange protein DsbD